MNVVSWQPDTPSFNSFEDTRGGTGPLTTNYTDGCDGRFRGVLQLGPLGTNVDLSAAGGTTANANGGAFSEGIDAAEKLVVIRGTKPALIKLSTRLNVADGSGAAFAAAATDIIYTYSAGGTEEISVATGDNSYEVMTAVPDTGGYTKSANNESIHNQIFGRVGSKNATGQIVGLGFASNIQNIVRTNILTGSTTMDASAWSTRATLSGFKGIFTGFINVNGAWFVGTDAGPYYLNDDFQTFEPLIPSLTRSSNHCKNMREHPSLGVIIPLERGIRIFRSVNDNDNVGPDQFWNNTSGVQGRLVSQCYSDQWLYWAIQNSITDTVYICAVRPRRDGDAHANKLSYYPILTLSAVDCDFMEFAGTKGSQTNPTVYYGRDSDAGWFIEGRGNRFPDDTNCFPADTKVSLDALPTRAFRRWYTGDLIEVTTSAGHKLAGTPNHPVFTDRGWVALGTLTEGDHVAYDGLAVADTVAANPNVEHGHASIGEIFDLAAVRSTTERRRGVGQDFHGDGQDGEVDVVTIDRELRDHIQARLSEPSLNQAFIGGDLGLSGLQSPTSHPQDIIRNLAPAPGSMRDVHPNRLSGRVLTLLPQTRSLVGAANRDAKSTQRFVDLVEVDSVRPSQVHSGFSGFVPSAQFGNVGRTPIVWPQRDVVLAEDSADGGGVFAKAQSDGKDALTSKVAFTDVVSIRRVPFSGHVYNLETENHRYGANGIVAHNCTYAASGNWYGTQIRRHRGQNIVPKAFRVRTSDCTSSETVTLSVDYLDHTGTSQNHVIGAPITSNGVHWLEVTKDKQISTEFPAPKLSLARGGTSTNTPRVLGEIEMFYELEDMKDAGGRTLTQVGVR